MDNPEERTTKETDYQKGKRHVREAFERAESKAEREQRQAFLAAQEALDEGRIKPVLIDTGAARTQGLQHRVTVRDPENSASRQVYTKIPKRLEALYILFADTREAGGAVLTREELDINPRTKDLPLKEKDALVKFWPSFTDSLERARELRVLRETETAIALKAGKAGLKFRKKHGFEAMDAAEQMDAVADELIQKVVEVASGFAAADIEEIHSDPLSATLHKQRMVCAKDFIWLGRNLVDLAERLRMRASGDFGGAELNEAALQALQAADAMLAGRGFKSEIVDAEVK